MSSGLKKSAFIYESEEELAKYSEEYPDKDAIKVWLQDGVACYIVHHEMVPPNEREACRGMFKKITNGLFEGMGIPPMSFDSYNGYCRFKEMPLSGSEFHRYVTVHGGITYGDRSPDGSYVYGFDTNHMYDSANPDIKSTEWLMGQCRMLACGVLVASEYEKEYLKANTQEGKGIVIENYRSYMSEEFDSDGEIGFVGLLNFLSGDL